MTHNRLTKRLFGCACLAAAASLSIAAAPALAQSEYGPAYDRGYNGQNELSDVTVTAPRRYIGRDAASGADIERVSTSRIVDYSDLDLRTRWGARALNDRIEDAARSACDELGAHYPDAADEEGSCVSTAARTAMDRVEPAYYDTSWRR